MKAFIPGQKSKLSDLTHATTIEVGLNIIPSKPLTLDLSCFGLDAAGKLSDDRYFVFYNQKASPGNAITMLGPRHGDQESFQVDLLRLPGTIRRLVFTVAIDGA